MIWELHTPYKDNPYGLGRIVSVYLNPQKTLIKRVFQPNGITVSGRRTDASEEYVNEKWTIETRNLLSFELKPWVPELVDINFKDRYVIQRYYGPDLLTAGFEDIPDIEDQLEDIYKYFKNINVYKLNSSLSNMTKYGSQVILFDFKYMKQRTPELKKQAEYEIDMWLSKIGPSIVPKLKALI